MTPEGEVRKHLRKQILATGGEHRKLRWIGRRSAPDEFGWWSGGPSAYFEVKRPGEVATDAQQREHARMRDGGLLVYVCDTKLLVDLTISMLIGMRQQND